MNDIKNLKFCATYDVHGDFTWTVIPKLNYLGFWKIYTAHTHIRSYPPYILQYVPWDVEMGMEGKEGGG